jgi:hypothetical protein
MPFYTSEYSPGSKKSILPILGTAVTCLFITFFSSLDAYIHSRPDRKPTKNQKRTNHKKRKK